MIEARFVSLAAGKLTVETAAGKSYTFPLQRLNEESRARAQALGNPADTEG